MGKRNQKARMDAPIVTTQNGKVSGTCHETVPATVPCYYYRDIPFAKTARFEKPVDFGSWGDKVWNGKVATRHYPSEDTFKSPEIMEYKKLFPIQAETMVEEMEAAKNPSEESLHLSVMTNDLTGSKPVMVWIHGGGWQSGTANSYFPTPLVGMGDVVVVCISYRLALGGFLFGNWGLFDQVKALEWVQSNIGVFGGDASNVTIFGESAGGWSIDALMCSPKASGLFHKGIAQSGSLRSVFKFAPVEANPAFPVLMKKYNLESVDALKEKLLTLTSAELVAAGAELGKAAVMFVHNMDNDFFVSSPDQKQLLTNKVPYMIGTNDAEHSWLLPFVMRIPPVADEELVLKFLAGPLIRAMGGEKAAAVAKQAYSGMIGVYAPNAPYDKSAPEFPLYIFKRAMADQWFHGGFIRANEIMADQVVHAYHLSIKTQAHHEGDKAKADWMGADHADDLMYVFGYPFNGRNLFDGAQFTAEEVELSRRMVNAWTSFAKTGSPGWAQYEAKDKVIKEFNKVDSLSSGNDENWATRTAYVKTVLDAVHKM